MTDKSSYLFDRITDGASRRNFLKKSALATAGAGLVASGTAAAQEDDENDFVDEERIRIAMFANDFRGGARFMITSGVIEWTPNVPQNLGGELTGYNTHMGTYLNTADRFTMFVSQEANLGANYDEDEGWFVDDEEEESGGFNQPVLYELANEYSFYEGSDEIITGYAYPLEQDVTDQIFADEGLNTEGEVNDFLF